MAALRRRREVTTALANELNSLQGVLKALQERRGELKTALEQLFDVIAVDQANPSFAYPVDKPVEREQPPLTVVSLNLQYYCSYPKDHGAGARRLHEVLGGQTPPDVICVQEGLSNVDVLTSLGFDKIVCSARRGLAQTVREMVYDDEGAMRACGEDSPSLTGRLCNQIYVRRDSQWQVADCGAEKISSDLSLSGGGGRVEGPLAIRSMVWVKLKRARMAGPATFVMCTHITGGRFEDQYFAQSLTGERSSQTMRCAEFFMKQRPGAKPDDVGILVGDFNATTEYAMNGPMHGYFKSSIASSKGVTADIEAISIDEAAVESSFKAYMLSPFEALRNLGWTFAYGPEVGITSGFGHLIDHMAISRPVKVASAEVIYLTNQKIGGKPPDTDLPLTDHNAVKTVFMV